ncbi:Uncharacterised protein [Serratia quinivorans]|nr:Uncharacterised protein [Serratia quinivorans]
MGTLPGARFDKGFFSPGLPLPGRLRHHAAGRRQVVELEVNGRQSAAQPAVERLVTEFALQEFQLRLALDLLRLQIRLLHFCRLAAHRLYLQLRVKLLQLGFGIVTLYLPLLTTTTPGF